MNLDADIQLAAEHEHEQRFAEAEAIYRRIVSQSPGYREALLGLARIAHVSSRVDVAVQILSRLAERTPDDAEIHRLLGDAWEVLGEFAEAAAAYRTSIALNPKSPKSHNGLGNAHLGLSQWPAAAAAFQKAIELDPKLAYAHSNLSLALREIGRMDECFAALDEAIHLDPDNGFYRNNLATALKSQGRIEEAIAASREALRLNPEMSGAHSNLLLMLHCRTGPSPQEIFEQHRHFAIQQAEIITPLAEHRNDRNPDRKLRVGYVSPDFRDHPVGRFVLPLLANHDREKFEVCCYSDMQVADSITKQIAGHASVWRNVGALNDDQLAVQIFEDQIDILVDLAGHTVRSRLLAFARKPAPVQITYLGYPDTTGLRTIDYRITDVLADPPGDADSYHTEKLLRLPRTAWCFQCEFSPAISMRDSDRPITLGCFSHLHKVSDAMLHLWARILKQLPDARLLLKSVGLDDPGTAVRVRRVLTSEGIADDRITTRGLMPSYSDHLAAYGEIDIALDTFPYNGTTTTCEAMWMGVPIVTMSGQAHASRVGVSLLSSVGLNDLIADSEDQYASIVIGLAKDRSQLTNRHRDLREMMRNSPLTDAIDYARAIESAYRDAWRRWCAS